MSDLPETDTGAAFQAGIATATADQAAQEASSAEFKAEMAQEAAQEAIQETEATRAAVWATADAVEDLRTEVAALRESVTPKVDDQQPKGEAEGGAGAVPAPERKEADVKPEPVEPGEESKPKRRAYGSRTWFGG